MPPRAKVERRIDPHDGLSYSFREISEFYKGTYKKQEVQAYWDHECQAAPGVMARALAKAEAAPIASPRPKAKAEAKAEVSVKDNNRKAKADAKVEANAKDDDRDWASIRLALDKPPASKPDATNEVRVEAEARVEAASVRPAVPEARQPGVPALRAPVTNTTDEPFSPTASASLSGFIHPKLSPRAVANSDVFKTTAAAEPPQAAPVSVSSPEPEPDPVAEADETEAQFSTRTVAAMSGVFENVSEKVSQLSSGGGLAEQDRSLLMPAVLSAVACCALVALVIRLRR